MPAQESGSDKKLPIDTWGLGPMQAAAYRDTIIGEGGEQRSVITVTFGKRIKNRDGQFQTVRTLYPQEIPAMIAVLQAALHYVQQDGRCEVLS